MLDFSDMKIGAWLLSATCAAGGLLLSGCGAATAPKPPAPTANTPNPPAPAASALAGNWLLIGPMPTNLVAPTTTGLRLAVTLDVNGNDIVAAGVGSNFCDNVGSWFEFGGPGTSITGTVATDGSFTLATPPNGSLGTVSINGMVPQASGGPWSGDYAVSLTGALAPKCDTNLSGTFTATSFPLISGVYAGTTSTTTIVNGVSTVTPVTLQVTLQQGGTVTDSSGKSSSSSSVLFGSIRVQGSPCFTSGVISATLRSEFLGNLVSARFTMDDGSTMLFSGSVADTTETRLTESTAIITGGQCGGENLSYQFPELDRQS